MAEDTGIITPYRNGRGLPDDEDQVEDQDQLNSLVSIKVENEDFVTEEQDKELVSLYGNEIEFQVEQFSNSQEKWVKWLRLYKGEVRTDVKNTPWEKSSNLSIAIAGSFVEQVVAKFMGRIFSTSPHWFWTQEQEKWSKHVKPLERYMDWFQSKIWNHKAQVKRATQEMCKIGTTMFSVVFKVVEDIRFKQGPDGNMQRVHNRLEYPAPEWFPREDFVIPEGFSDLQRAPWIARRYWYSKPELETLITQGFFVIPEDIREKFWSSPDELSDVARERNEDQEDPTDRDPEFGMWAIWMVCFKRDLDGDGFPEENTMYIHIKSSIMMRSPEPNPYSRQVRPFVKACYVEEEGRFDGLGIPELIQMHQEEISTTHNQRIDSNSINNMPLFGARKGAGIKGNIKLHPGKILFLQDPKSDFQRYGGGNTMQTSYQDEQGTISLAKERVGLSDPQGGNVSNAVGRAAASTMMNITEENNQRHDLNISDLRTALTTLGQFICELWQTHGLPDPENSMSPERVLGEEDGMLVREIIDQEDSVVGIATAKLNVSTSSMDRTLEKDTLFQLFDVVTQYSERMLQILPALNDPELPDEARQAIIDTFTGADELLSRIFMSHQQFDLGGILMGEKLEEMYGRQATAGPPGDVGPPQAGPQGPLPGLPEQGNGLGPMGPGPMAPGQMGEL